MNTIGLVTLVRRELRRTLQVINQVIWPPVISTLLYFFIFVIGLGRAVGHVEGLPYIEFLVPGLIFMNVVEASFGEASASLFGMRFQASIQELLVAPLSYSEMVLGLISGSVLRALLIGNLILLVAYPFGGALPANWAAYLLLMIALAVMFSALGLMLALAVESWDQMAIPNTFLVTPLIFLGGVFTSVGTAFHQLPGAIRALVFYNPMVYFVDGLRTAITGHPNPFGLLVVGSWHLTMWSLDVTLTLLGTVVAFGAALWLFQQGFKLRA